MNESRRWHTRAPWLLAGALITAGTRKYVRKKAAAAAGAQRLPGHDLSGRVAEVIDHRVGWDKLPMPLGTLVLRSLRAKMRRHNFIDTSTWPTVSPQAVEWNPALGAGRSSDGSFNDLANPRMGMRNTRFGRNLPINEIKAEVPPALLDPNPRTVSRELLARREFIPATTVNLLAASWLQFMVKDWFSHGEGSKDQLWEIEIDPEDPWPTRPFTILKTLPDPTRPGNDGLPPTFLNTSTHWWDASQIYGSSRKEQQMRRTDKDDGKLRIGDDGLLVFPSERELNPTLVPGWWLGLEMLGTLFIREHNAVCDHLASRYPHWTGEQVFQHARLVVSALLAKIHTVEWTAAILDNPVMVKGVHTHWWGLLGERVNRAFDLTGWNELLGGVPGTETDHFGVPFSLTEEFTIVYRMHPLIPDIYLFRSLETDAGLFTRDFESLNGPKAEELTHKFPMADIFYSFGRANPGAICLHNFPTTLMQFKRPKDGILMDLGAIDILRARELGVPRYNQFRRLLHLKPARTFEALTGGNKELASEISRVYGGDIEKVDLTVGMFAEPTPKGFAFSDTAFRIFLLMAARRFNSDRFLSKDFNEKVYSPAGMEWVQSNTFMTVLLRHYPELAPALHGVRNGFQPWTPVIDPESDVEEDRGDEDASILPAQTPVGAE